ncbi:hypothetical protein GURASL_09340 [Geotalea uraniireducens]|uniref:histidine kinase n=1 Tax=Geotalea uraniireducens TaxID=351604 RepID=A0ABN6VT61_9BACT|nr:hypothetical protein GURASL_09340 [Geotalea uraniireducens]
MVAILSPLAARGAPPGLPEEHRHRLSDLYAEFSTHFWGAVSVLLILLIVISLLIYIMRQRFRVEISLRQSEEKYRELVQNANSIIMRLDSAGTITFFNEFAQKFFGFTEEEVLGKSPLDTIVPERESTGRDLRTLIAAVLREPARYERNVNENVRKNGERVWVSWANKPVCDAAGRLREYLCVGTDITDRKRAEEELRRSEKRFATIFNTAAVSLWEEDFSAAKAAIDGVKATWSGSFRDFLSRHPDFAEQTLRLIRIVDVNDWTLTLYEAPSKAALLGGLHRIATPETCRAFEGCLQAIAEGKAFFEVETVNRTFAGRTIDVLMRVAIPAPGADFGNLLVSIVDITARKRAEQAIREMNAELERRVHERTVQLESSNRELESFCYSVSHDLRAPLRHINSFSAIIMEEKAAALDEDVRELLGRVQAASRRMGLLIDDLLELSRVTRSAISVRNVDVSALVRTIVDELQAAEPQRQVEVRIDDGLAVLGDYRLLQVALQNLLDNAWKYTAKNPAAAIHVGRETVDGREVLFIRDNGVGFNMAYADKLFGAFQRLHRPGEFEGTGIGLATVQRIVQLHGGEVWGYGEEGKGATFYLSFPGGGAGGRPVPQ